MSTPRVFCVANLLPSAISLREAQAACIVLLPHPAGQHHKASSILCIQIFMHQLTFCRLMHIRPLQGLALYFQPLSSILTNRKSEISNSSASFYL